jgi:mono/diheme cytochrome c family protein
MNVRRISIAAGVLGIALATVFSLLAQPVPAPAPAPMPVTTAPTYVPDFSHQNDPLPDDVLAWDATQKTVTVTNGLDFARFTFYFTNVYAKAEIGLATNVMYTTNFTVVTNRGFWSVISGNRYQSTAHVIANTNRVTVTNSLKPELVTILSVHPSCGCTTAEIPPPPWMLPPGTNSQIKVNVNLAGKSGSVFKYVTVTTDKGKMNLNLVINILPAPPAPPMTEAQRAAGVAAAKIDRQAVFKGDCASCHAKNVEGRYGEQLFVAVCGVCHEANPRSTMVPDLHNLKEQTSEQFWTAWITAGKAGTLMPAFATSQGGPLNDMQIASLAAYLNSTIPPHAPAIK